MKVSAPGACWLTCGVALHETSQFHRVNMASERHSKLLASLAVAQSLRHSPTLVCRSRLCVLR